MLKWYTSSLLDAGIRDAQKVYHTKRDTISNLGTTSKKDKEIKTSNFKLQTPNNSRSDRDPIKFFEIPNKIPRRTPVNITVTIDSTLRL